MLKKINILTSVNNIIDSMSGGSLQNLSHALNQHFKIACQQFDERIVADSKKYKHLLSNQINLVFGISDMVEILNKENEDWIHDQIVLGQKQPYLEKMEEEEEKVREEIIRMESDKMFDDVEFLHLLSDYISNMIYKKQEVERLQILHNNNDDEFWSIINKYSHEYSQSAYLPIEIGRDTCEVEFSDLQVSVFIKRKKSRVNASYSLKHSPIILFYIGSEDEMFVFENRCLNKYGVFQSASYNKNNFEKSLQNVKDQLFRLLSMEAPEKILDDQIEKIYEVMQKYQKTFVPEMIAEIDLILCKKQSIEDAKIDLKKRIRDRENILRNYQESIVVDLMKNYEIISLGSIPEINKMLEVFPEKMSEDEFEIYLDMCKEIVAELYNKLSSEVSPKAILDNMQVKMNKFRVENMDIYLDFMNLINKGCKFEKLDFAKSGILITGIKNLRALSTLI